MGIRCATVITVESLNSVLIVFWRIASVALSIDAVASSRTKIRHLLRSARPKQKSCLWPMLQFEPSSTTIQRSPSQRTRQSHMPWYPKNITHICVPMWMKIPYFFYGNQIYDFPFKKRTYLFYFDLMNMDIWLSVLLLQNKCRLWQCNVTGMYCHP